VLNWFGGTVALWDGSDTGNLTAVVVPGESFTPFRANVSWNQARTHFLTWNAIGLEIPIVRVWAITGQLEGITQIMTLRHEDERIDGAAWSPDETMILSWSQNMVKVWDVASVDAVDLLHVLNTDSYITAADWSPNSRYILVRDIRQNAMRIWDARAGEEALTIPGTAMWDTSGDRLLVGRQTVTLLDVATGETLAEFGPSLGLGHAYWNPDGVRLLARTAFGIQVWIIPSPDRCVVHALAPVNLRAEPSTESARVDVLPIRRLLPVIGQAVGADDFIWWQVADDLWVRSDVVEATGYCPSDD
jgi:WD40 repeat protein